MKYLFFLLFLMVSCVFGSDTIQTPEIAVWAEILPAPIKCNVWVEVDGVSSTTITLHFVGTGKILARTAISGV